MAEAFGYPSDVCRSEIAVNCGTATLHPYYGNQPIVVFPQLAIALP